MSAAKKPGLSIEQTAVPKPPANISAEGRKWLEENAEAIRSINEWVEKNGLPLEKYRMFRWRSSMCIGLGQGWQ